MTPAGRKDLIQRYLSLRDKKIKKESPILTSCSSTRDEQRSKPSQRIIVSRSSGDSSASFGNDNFGNPPSVGSLYTDNGNSQESPYNRRRGSEGKNGYDDASRYYHHVDSAQSLSFNSIVRRNCNQGINIGPSSTRLSQRKEEELTPLSLDSMSMAEAAPYERCDIDRTKTSVKIRGDSDSLVNDYNNELNEKETCGSPSLVSYLNSRQKKLSYSFLSDNDSSSSSSLFDTYKLVSVTPQAAFDTYKPDSITPRTAPLSSSYEDELSPHNQFMKIQLGLGFQ